jgi:pimeloyl-ACP methyl ester carboxylesterase
MNRFFKINLIACILIVCILAIIPFIRNTEKYDLDDAARLHAPGKFVTLSNGITHYQIAGPAEGQTIILIHGFSVPMYIYDSTFNVLSDAGFQVLRFDLWGRGYSSRPKVSYDLKLFIRQVKELIDSLNLSPPVDLIGVSMGGTIVAGFVNEYPQLVRNVVLIDPGSVKKDITPLNIPILGDYLAAAFWIPALPQSQLNDFYQPDRFQDWPIRFKEQMKYKGFRYAILTTARNLLNQDYISFFSKLNDRHVLLIWGSQDKNVPLSQSDTLRNLINPEFLLIDNAGHLPHFEQPSVVNGRLIEFLKHDHKK